MNINKLLPDGRITMLIDADIYLYRACSTTEQEHDWGDDVWSLATDLKDAKDYFAKTMKEFQSELDIDDFILCTTSSNNFRKEVLSTYKSNRKATRKPVGYRALVDWAVEEYPSMSLPRLEADDVMGILQTLPGKETYIVSDDKDMMTIPGRLYQPQKLIKKNISETEAFVWFLRQTLTGDTVDGYAGIKGIGPKRADQIINRSPTWRAVEAEYIKNGYTTEDAKAQARCARILRSADYNLETETIRLWEPSYD